MTPLGTAVNLQRVPCLQHFDRTWRRHQLIFPCRCRQCHWRPVPGKGPREKLPFKNKMESAVHGVSDHGATWKTCQADQRLLNVPSFSIQSFVDVRGQCHIRQTGLQPGDGEQFVCIRPALRAWSMAGCECRGFIQKKEFGVAARLIVNLNCGEVRY